MQQLASQGPMNCNPSPPFMSGNHSCVWLRVFGLYASSGSPLSHLKAMELSSVPSSTLACKDGSLGSRRSIHSPVAGKKDTPPTPNPFFLPRTPTESLVRRRSRYPKAGELGHPAHLRPELPGVSLEARWVNVLPDALGSQNRGISGETSSPPAIGARSFTVPLLVGRLRVPLF